MLRVLVEARLVTVGEGTVEVAHEALIRHWPTLRAWLDEDREGRLVHRRLTEAAQEWETLGKEPGALYRGTRLAAAAEWAEQHDDELNELEREFLELRPGGGAERGRDGSEAQPAPALARRGTRALATQRARRRRIRARAALGAQDKARVAQAGRLAAQSREAAGQHPDLALLLALEAGRLDDSIDTRGALLGALEHGRGSARGPRGSTRLSSPRRSVRTAGSWRP